MLISIIILILLLPVTILPLVLKTSFSSNELKEMGIFLENPVTASSDEHICQQNILHRRCRSSVEIHDRTPFQLYYPLGQ